MEITMSAKLSNKFIVDYGTIHGMKVHLPGEDINGYGLLKAWAKAYVEYVFSQSVMCSDEALVRSIGSDNAKEALILGIQRNLPPETAEVFKDIAESPGLWECFLLKARHGSERGFEIYMREFSGEDPEIAEKLIESRRER
jgi:hypothetical protein